MREILFEAIALDGKKVQGLPLGGEEFEFSYYRSMQACDATGYWGIKRIRPETLSQYTGYRGIGGTRLFENNLVKDPKSRREYLISWSEESRTTVLKDRYGDEQVSPAEFLDANTGYLLLELIEEDWI